MRRALATVRAQAYIKPRKRSGSTLAKGRFRSGQTEQTVNLLALRLRWFESSPAQIPRYRRRFDPRLAERERTFPPPRLAGPRRAPPRRAFDVTLRFRELLGLRRAACPRPVLRADPAFLRREVARRLTRPPVRERLAAAPRLDFLA